MNSRTFLAVGLLAPVMGLLVGCGTPAEKTVTVKGRLTKGGAPYTVKEATGGKSLPPGDPGIRMQFVRTTTKGEETFNGAVDGNTGSFEALGVTGKGIPPGKYTVTVFAGAYGAESERPSGGGGGGAPPVAGGGSSGETFSMQGRPVHKQDVDIPDAGTTDLVIDIKGK